MKLIGFDATEDHRTYSDGGKLKVCPAPDLPPFGERYTVGYPLREWGLDRAACGRIITGAGLPLPPKSACFFCPAMKQIEIMQLAFEDPALHALALEMERLYRDGQHFRGDEHFTVKAKHKVTGELLVLEMSAKSVAHARAQFRQTHNDTAQPYRWKVAAYPAVRGLGRNFAWNQLEYERIPA